MLDVFVHYDGCDFWGLLEETSPEPQNPSGVDFPREAGVSRRSPEVPCEKRPWESSGAGEGKLLCRGNLGFRVAWSGSRRGGKGLPVRALSAMNSKNKIS
ncbi:UNVERIFIED_CONTAM: hypothetical protein K2H54_009306 [Gekko kuhli]